MKDLIVRFPLNDLAILNRREILRFRVRDIAHGRVRNRFEVGIGFGAVRFRRHIETILSFPYTDQAR
jgi:hypothetical protein